MPSPWQIIWASVLCLLLAAPLTSSQATQEVTYEGDCELDLIFLVDGSYSMGNSNYRKLLNAVLKYIKELPMGHNMVHVGVVAFSTTTAVVELSGDYVKIAEDVKALPYHGRFSYTHSAFSMAGNMFDSNGRLGVPRVIILLTDGPANYHNEAMAEANYLISEDVTIWAVGIGSDIDVGDLLDYADTSDHLVLTRTFDPIPAMIDLPLACTEVLPPPPVITTFRPVVQTTSTSKVNDASSTKDIGQTKSSSQPTSTQNVDSSATSIRPSPTQNVGNTATSNTNQPTASQNVGNTAVSNSNQPSPTQNAGNTATSNQPSQTQNVGNTATSNQQSPTQNVGNTATSSQPTLTQNVGNTATSNQPSPTQNVGDTATSNQPTPTQNVGNTATSNSNQPTATQNVGNTATSNQPSATQNVGNTATSNQPSATQNVGNTATSNQPSPTKNVGNTATSNQPSPTQNVGNTATSNSNQPSPTQNVGNTATSNQPSATQNVGNTATSNQPSPTQNVGNTATSNQPTPTQTQDVGHTETTNQPTPSQNVGNTATSNQPSPTQTQDVGHTETSSQIQPTPSQSVGNSKTSSQIQPIPTSNLVPSQTHRWSASMSVSHSITEPLSTSPGDPTHTSSYYSASMSASMEATSTSTIPEPSTAPTTMGPDRLKTFTDSLCIDAQRVDGLWLTSHPTDCDKFIQCHYPGQGKVVTSVRMCPRGNFWSRVQRTCMAPRIANCSMDPCQNRDVGRYPMDGGCGLYWQCLEGVSTGQSCQRSHAYTSSRGCIPSPRCKTVAMEESCDSEGPCQRMPLPGNRAYQTKLEAFPGDWMTTPCLYGATFDLASCSCLASRPFAQDCQHIKKFQRNFPPSENETEVDRKSNGLASDPRSSRPLALRFRYKPSPHKNDDNKGEILIRSSECPTGGLFVLWEEDDLLEARLFSRDGYYVKASLPLMGLNDTDWRTVNIRYTFSGDLSLKVTAGLLAFTNFVQGGLYMPLSLCGWEAGLPGSLSEQVAPFTGDLEEIYISRCYDHGF